MISAAELSPAAAEAFRIVLGRYRAALIQSSDPPIGKSTCIAGVEQPLCNAVRCKCLMCPLGPHRIGCVFDGFTASVFPTPATRPALALRYFALRRRAAEIGFAVNPRMEGTP